MIARQGWLVGGTVLALFACDIVRADEPVGVTTSSSVAVQPTSSQPVARRARRFWLFGGSVYTTAAKTVPSTATGTTAAPAAATSTAAAPALVTRTTRPQDAQQPAIPSAAQPVQPQPSAPAASTQLSASIFGSASVPTSQLSQERRSRGSAGSSDYVSGRESGVRATTDAGSLLGKSSQARGISTQQRTPIMTDTRIRGSGVGRMVASGG